MKLRDYAKKAGVSYRTAWRWWKAGKLPGYQMDTGTIIVTEEPLETRETAQRIALYARVAAAENKLNLQQQAERLIAYCNAKGYQFHKVVKEVGLGLDDSCPKLLALLEDSSITLIVIEHKDRLTRFGYRYLETLLRAQGRQIEVVNQTENGTEDLLADLSSLVYTFCVRIYGHRRAKRKTEQLMTELEAKEKED